MAAQDTFSSVTVTNTVELVRNESCILRLYDSKNRSLTDEISVQLFDAKDPADVVLGTTEPKFNFAIPADGGLFFNYDKTQGPLFNRGLCIAVTATPQGNDAPASSPTVNLMLLKAY